MERSIHPYRIAIWQLSAIDRTQDWLNLPRNLQNNPKAGEIEVLTLQPSQNKMNNAQLGYFDNRLGKPYQFGIERLIRRKSKRASRRLKYLINHQYHLIDYIVFNEVQALKMPGNVLNIIRTANLLVLVIDERIIKSPIVQNQTMADKVLKNGRSVDDYLKEQVKKSSYYQQYKMNLETSAQKQSGFGKTQTQKIPYESYQTLLSQILSMKSANSQTVAILLDNQLANSKLRDFLLSMKNIDDGKKNKEHRKQIKFYHIDQLAQSQSPKNEMGLFEAVIVEGISDLVLLELECIEKDRIRRKGLVRFLFGNDSVRAYKPYKRKLDLRIKSKKVTKNIK